MLVKYNTIRDMDISNGEGIACSIFFQGCSHHCEGCFNPETWSFDTGKEFTEEVQHKFIEMCKKPYIKCISLLGGEPFDQDSCELYNFLKRLKQEVNKPVYLWTGYLYEELLEKDCIIPMILPDSSEKRRNIEQYLIDNNINYSVEIEIPNSVLLKKLILNGLGVGYINKKFIEEELKSGKLMILDIFKNVPTDNVSIVFNSKNKNKLINEFINIIKMVLKK